MMEKDSFTEVENTIFAAGFHRVWGQQGVFVRDRFKLQVLPDGTMVLTKWMVARGDYFPTSQRTTYSTGQFLPADLPKHITAFVGVDVSTPGKVAALLRQRELDI